MTQRTMPSRHRIAEYWQIDNEAEAIRLDIWCDYGEPQCWFCDYYPQSAVKHDGKVDKQGRAITPWKEAKFLERSHIVPKALGGSDSPENLVMLCRRCHEDAPDTSNRDMFFAWGRARKHHYSSFLDWLTEVDASPEEMDTMSYLFRCRGFIASLGLSTHASKISDGTKQCAVLMTLEALRNDPVSLVWLNPVYATLNTQKGTSL